MTSDNPQRDLFDTREAVSTPPEPLAPTAPTDAAALADAALLAAVAGASGRSTAPLVAELVRRRLPGAEAAFEALCRRFKGFGTNTAITEQILSLEALAKVGGAAAREAVTRLLVGGVVQRPGLLTATTAAAALGARLPAPVALPLLRDADPRLRAAACRCARLTVETTPLVVDLLADLHDTVADAAALALALAGRIEARPRLAARLLRDPSAEIVEAYALIADDDGIVQLGRLADRRADLTQTVLRALESMDTERADAVARGIRRRLPP